MGRKQPKPKGYLGRPKRPKWIAPGQGPIGAPEEPSQGLAELGRDYLIDFNDPLIKAYDASNPCQHIKGFPCGDCGKEKAEDL